MTSALGGGRRGLVDRDFNFRESVLFPLRPVASFGVGAGEFGQVEALGGLDVTVQAIGQNEPKPEQ